MSVNAFVTGSGSNCGGDGCIVVYSTELSVCRIPLNRRRRRRSDDLKRIRGTLPASVSRH